MCLASELKETSRSWVVGIKFKDAQPRLGPEAIIIDKTTGKVWTSASIWREFHEPQTRWDKVERYLVRWWKGY